MKKLSRVFNRALSLLLTAVMVASLFVAVPIAANAETTKTEKSYDIAVVFDNSGSMYTVMEYDHMTTDGKAWSRAKYSMEIFASMLNYNKDRLRIFPMWKVTTDGSQSNSGGSKDAVEIRSKEDIDKITNLYTINASGTPFTPVIDAHNALLTSNADEKWLIIITDGLFSNTDLREEISKLATAGAAKGIKIQYLGFDGVTEKDVNLNGLNNVFAKVSDAQNLKNDLIEICNSIFQREILPKNRLSGRNLTLDLSMKNIIVFAQGADAKILSLTDANGNEIPISMDSGQRKYSEISCGKYTNAPTDTSLAGQVVTFNGCPRGEYTLNYTGVDAETIQIFYEPDVKIVATFTNSEGEEVQSADELVAGEYTITSKLVDAKFPEEDVTNHELMGKDVKLRTYVKASSDSEKREYENGAKITLEPDEETELWVEGTYLGKYKISSKDDFNWDWPFPIKILPPPPELTVNATVLQDGSWFTLSDHEKWKPIKVDITMDGQPLTDEQMARTTLEIEPSSDLVYRYEPIPGKSAYYVYIAQDEDGNYVEPETGDYSLEISAVYTDDFNQVFDNKDEASFEVNRYSLFIKRLIVAGMIIIPLIIIAIIAFILHKIKVLPTSVTTADTTYKIAGKVVGAASANIYVTKNSLFKKTGTISVSTTDGRMGISLSIESNHNLFNVLFKYQKSAQRRYKITSISAAGMNCVKINGSEYKPEEFGNITEFGGGVSPVTIELGKTLNGKKYSLKTDVRNI